MKRVGLMLVTGISVIFVFSCGLYAQQSQPPQSGAREIGSPISDEVRRSNQQLGQRWVESLGSGVQNAPASGSQQVAQKRPAPVSGRWERVTSLQGRFSVELPEGWEIRQSQIQGDPVLVAQENVVTFGPIGTLYPGVGVMGWIRADVWQELQTGAQDPEINRLMCQRVSAQKFYSEIFAPLLRCNIRDLKIERITPGKPSALARVEGSFSHEGQPYRTLVVVNMEYLNDPTLPLSLGCPQAWHSIPFVGDLVASPKEFPSLVPVAERIFSTFRPTPRWGEEVMTLIFQAMETRMAIIGRTVSRVTKMETQQRMQEIQSMRRISQRWVDTVGGRYRYSDPKDPSYQGTIPGSQVPSGPTRWWKCGSQAPVASDRSPGYGCQPTAPPY